MTDRFKPSRAGVVNLWDYRDEEFVFADGRLVLRGPNGSGKTKALEVLFPFVLDGRIEPRRLNPFASEERTMKSNLLYRGQDAAHSYVWLEFARGTEWVTVGVGLRAQRHNDRVTRWYFVADGRAGVDFSLIGPDDRPLTRKELAAELGAEAITDKPADHRAAVDARLFGLGSERYEQLLTLVLTLRRPQLAKHLDPKGLSATLSDGLRPLDDALITEAARSFDDMERVQRTLDGLVAADDAARAFLSSYLTYLRTHARAAADAVGTRLDAVDDGRTRLAAALSRSAASTRAAGEADRESEAAQTELTRQRAHLESLQRSEAYTAKEQLDELVELVEELQAAAQRAIRQAASAAGAAQAREAEADQARQVLADAERSVTRAAAALAEAAAEAGIAWEPVDAESDAEFAARVTARAEVRRDDVTAVRAALDAVAQARAERTMLQAGFNQAEQAAAAAETTLAAAEQAVDAARAAAQHALAAWWSRHEPTITDLEQPQVHELLTQVLDAVGEPDALRLPARFDDLLEAPVQQRREVLLELRAERKAAEAERADLQQRREAIAAERDDAPPAFAARTAERGDRAGAPLWRLVRFADTVTEERAASVEAAIEAANMLDAWLHPADDDSAAALRAGGSDGYLVPLPPERRPSGATLADVLVPEQGAPVSASRVSAVLSSIALAEVTASPAPAPAVSPEGRFAQGIQVGAHRKDHAEYIGTTARARRRAARLAELDQQIAAADGAIGNLEERIRGVQALLGAVGSARRELPSTSDILAAAGARQAAAVELRVRREHLDEARTRLDEAVAAVGDRERRLTRVAANRAVPADADGVARLAAAVDRFTAAASALVAAREKHGLHADQADKAERELTAARRDAHTLAAEASEAASRHAAQDEKLATLRAAVGADVEQVLAEAAATRAAIKTGEQAVRDTQDAYIAAREEAARAGEAVRAATETLTSAVAESQADARRLAPYAHRELLDLLRVPSDIGWPAADTDWREPAELAATAARELATQPDTPVAALPQAVAQLLTAVATATPELRPTEASLKSSKTRVVKALDDLDAQLSAAGHDFRPEWQADADVIIVRVADEHGFAPVGVFADRIAAARRDQELLLTDSERRILEDALLGRLAQQIHDRTIDARDLIGRMAREMRTRRMSSGAGIGVHWELADALDEHGRAVCKLLERDAAGLGPDELSGLRSYFAGQIKTARAQHPDRSYAELLSEVLDYRRWRAFGFTLIGPDGGEERLTQARHSTLSGGEQSVSLHLPLFAAAHVMLSSAAPDCPRLLALDEAFAGVDDNGRRELLGLTAQFDLDLFMTGYDLWATYDTVPACAHYDLSHSAAEHTVSALLLVWDGKEILADTPSADLAGSLGSPGTRRRPAHDSADLLSEGDS